LNQCYRFFIYAVYREDNQQLYGFRTLEERNCFQLLVEKVNGIGPKLALVLLSWFSMQTFCAMVLQQDVHGLAKCPGLGDKTAKRLILELQGHLKALSTAASPHSPDAIYNDAIEGLIVLGYARKQAENLVHRVQTNHPQLTSVETILKLALQTNAAQPASHPNG
jgi:Holliday junction DNA helicase RuvA